MSVIVDRQDGLSSAAAWKGPCIVATTGNIVLAGLQTIDGRVLVDGDRVLVQAQTSAVDNGIYVADTGNWRRSADFSKTPDVVTGTRVAVVFGTTFAGRDFELTSENPVLIDTSAITFRLVEKDALSAVSGVIIYLSDFIRETPSDYKLALYNAHVALFTPGIARILDCEGIPIDLTSSFQIRNSDATMQSNREVRNLNLTAIGTGWTDYDYMYSVCGQDDQTILRSFLLHRPSISMGGLNLVGIHISGYYHYTIFGAYIRNMGNAAVGIYSSKWGRTAGLSTLVSEAGDVSGDPTDGVKNSSHGAEIINIDAAGTFGVDDSIVGILTEDGDFNVTSGWLSWMNTGIWTKQGGLNTRNVHFSMGDKSTQTKAIYCTAPREVSCLGDELDGCVYTFDNPTNNSYSPGVSKDGYNNIVLRGFKHESGKVQPAGTLWGAIVNFRTQTVDNYVNGLVVQPDWARESDDADNVNRLVWFRASGAGTWKGSSFRDVIVTDTNNPGVKAASLPQGAKYGLVRAYEGSTDNDSAGVAYDGDTYTLEFFRDATVNRPAFRTIGDQLQVGNNISGTFTAVVKFDQSDGITIIPPNSTTPDNNGELVIERTNNTTLTFKLRGTDGTVRSGTLTLS